VGDAAGDAELGMDRFGVTFADPPDVLQCGHFQVAEI